MRQLRLQYITDFAMLNYLCGIVDTEAFAKTLMLPNMDVQLFANNLSSAFFRRYTLDSLRLQNQMKLIKLSYRPRFTVFADAGYQTTQLSNIHQNVGVSGGFNINLPIYDGGRRKLTLEQISLQEDSRRGYRQFFELQHNQQLASLMQQLSATQSLQADIEAQIKYTRGLIEVNEKLLQTGDARIPDFVIAINNYMMAQTLLTQNRISRLQIINQVNYWNR
jgi:outer membrane protein TolC